MHGAEIHQFPNPATPRGSANYYTVRFAPLRCRPDLALILSWYQELRGIQDRMEDADIARMKLLWWREELEKVAAGTTPQHPVNRYLSPVIERQRLDPKLFHNVMDAVEADILKRTYHDLPSLLEYSRLGQASLFELLAICSGCKDEQHLEYVRQLGLFEQLVMVIVNLGADLRAGRCYLPRDLLLREQLNHDQLLNQSHQPQLLRLLDSIGNDATQLLLEARSGFDISSRPATLVALDIYANLSQALLQEVDKDIVSVLRQKSSLTPLRMLWIAWKTFRRW